jgi:hypothetical protein
MREPSLLLPPSLRMRRSESRIKPLGRLQRNRPPFGKAYFAIVACMTLDRCAPQAPHLLLSMES